MSLELCFKRRSVALGSELSRQNNNIRKKNNAVNANFSQKWKNLHCTNVSWFNNSNVPNH